MTLASTHAPKSHVDRDTYDKLVAAFRLAPGMVSRAGREAGVSPATARRAWEVGWPARGFEPICRTMEAEARAVRARLARLGAREERVSLKEASLRPIVDEARERSVALKRREEWAQTCAGNRAVGGTALAALHRTFKGLFARIDLIEAALMDKDLTPAAYITILQRSLAAYSSLSAAIHQNLQTEHLAIGAPTQIVGVQVGASMTMEEAERQHAKVGEVLARQRARRLERGQGADLPVIEGDVGEAHADAGSPTVLPRSGERESGHTYPSGRDRVRREGDASDLPEAPLLPPRAGSAASKDARRARLLELLPDRADPMFRTSALCSMLGVGMTALGRDLSALRGAGLVYRSGEGTCQSPHLWFRPPAGSPPQRDDDDARVEARILAAVQADARGYASLDSLLPVVHLEDDTILPRLESLVRQGRLVPSRNERGDEPDWTQPREVRYRLPLRPLDPALSAPSQDPGDGLGLPRAVLAGDPDAGGPAGEGGRGVKNPRPTSASGAPPPTENCPVPPGDREGCKSDREDSTEEVGLDPATLYGEEAGEEGEYGSARGEGETKAVS
jgi:hypothetical protein